jgi:hypothetical protein
MGVVFPTGLRGFSGTGFMGRVYGLVPVGRVVADADSGLDQRTSHGFEISSFENTKHILKF